jgi:hypothetical protein
MCSLNPLRGDGGRHGGARAQSGEQSQQWYRQQGLNDSGGYYW